MEVTPGILADATKVQRLMQDAYGSWNKSSTRTRCVRSIVRLKPERVGVLWGGGGDTTALVAAGVNVLMIDDGRDERIVQSGISIERYRRAMETAASSTGQEAAWGRALDYVSRVDAAILDFMSHPSHEVLETLEACRHMRGLTVTLMIGRLSVGEQLPDEYWAAALGGIVERATFMRVQWYHLYRRSERQQKAIVLFLRPATKSGLVSRCECGVYVPPSSRKCPSCTRKSGVRLDTTKHRRDEFYSPSPDARRRTHKHSYYVKNRNAYKARGEEQYARKSGQTVEHVREAKLFNEGIQTTIKAMIQHGYTNVQISDATGYSQPAIGYHRKKLAAVSGTTAEAID